MRTRTPGIAAAGRHLRLVAGGAEPHPTPEPALPVLRSLSAAGARRPKPPPSIGARWAGIGVARARASAAAELSALCNRVADLEHANRRLSAAVEAAQAEGERIERERTVRTMAGRLPSILIGGRR